MQISTKKNKNAKEIKDKNQFEIETNLKPGRTQEGDSNCTTTTQFAVFFNKNNMYFLLFLCKANSYKVMLLAQLIAFLST